MIPELIALEKQNELLRLIETERWKAEPDEVLAHGPARTSLMYGDTYFWSKEMCDVISVAARKLNQAWTLTREMVPSSSGFFYFEKPPSYFRPSFVRTEWDDGSIEEEIVEGDARRTLWLRAISWTVFRYRKGRDIAFQDENGKVRKFLETELLDHRIVAMDAAHEWGSAVSSEGRGSLEDSDGILISFWIDNPNLGRRGAGKISGSWTDTATIVPNGYCQWRFGKSSDDMIIAEAINLGKIPNVSGGREITEEDREEFRRVYTLDDMNESGRMDNQVICTAFSFLLEDVMNGKTRVGMDRGMRKRAERAIDKGEMVTESAWVKVVKLRKVRHPEDGRDLDETSEGREYHCRWVVSGHWRKQWYPGLGIHQPKWIMPHVKGPEGLPFKETETIYSVRR